MLDPGKVDLLVFTAQLQRWAVFIWGGSTMRIIFVALVSLIVTGCANMETPAQHQARASQLEASCGKYWKSVGRGDPIEMVLKCYPGDGEGSFTLTDESQLSDGSRISYYHFTPYTNSIAMLLRVEDGYVTSWTRWDQRTQ